MPFLAIKVTLAIRRACALWHSAIRAESIASSIGMDKLLQDKVSLGADASVIQSALDIESKTKTEVENGKDRETKTRTEGTSGALDMPLLGVKSMKTISSDCL